MRGTMKLHEDIGLPGTPIIRRNRNVGVDLVVGCLFPRDCIGRIYLGNLARRFTSLPTKSGRFDTTADGIMPNAHTFQYHGERLSDSDVFRSHRTRAFSCIIETFLAR